MRILARLRDAGIRRVVLNLHHRADTITRIVGDGSTVGLEVRYSWETDILGSAGGPARAVPLLESDRFLIVNGDTLADVDLHQLTAAARRDQRARDDGGGRRRSAIQRRSSPNASGMVRGFGRAEAPDRRVSLHRYPGGQCGGVRGRESGRPIRDRPWHLPGADRQPATARSAFFTRPRSFSTSARRAIISTPRPRSRAANSAALDRGSDCVVAPDATLSNTILWDRVRIGAGAELTDCIVADGVTVPPGARYSQSSLVMRDNDLLAQEFDGREQRR